MAATVACSNTTCCSAFPSLPITPPHKFSVSPKSKLLFNSDIKYLTLSICLSRTSSPLCSSSSASSTPTVAEQVAETTASGDLPLQSEPSSVNQDSDPFLSTRGCKACGREEIEQGCNGKGRIQGGIATVPGFGWWPIKAYRPCPGFVAAGGRYRRTGQNMDEIGFGGGQRAAPMGNDGEAKASKKKQGARKVK